MLYFSNRNDLDNNDRMYILDIHNGEVEEIKLDFSLSDAVLYKDYIIVSQQYTPSPPQLDLHDRNGNFVQTIALCVFSAFAFIDNAVYYRPEYHDEEYTIPGSTIMRYDLASGETEKVLEFDISKTPSGAYLWPAVHFNGRAIIINNHRSVIYMSIDKLEPIEIVFDFEIGEDRNVKFIPSSDDDLHFLSLPAVDYDVAFDGGDVEEDYEYGGDYYRVAHGTNEPIFLKEYYPSDSYMECFSDGYLYYFDPDRILVREKFY